MLLRLNTDGSPDSAFGNSGIAGLAVMPDLAGGLRVQGIESVARLHDGSLFAAGTAVAGGPIQGFVVKITAEGLVDESFGITGVALFPLYQLHAVRIDALDRIVIAGEHYDGRRAAYVASVLRLKGSGALDLTFGKDGVFAISGADTTASGSVRDIVLEPGGGIVAGGSFETAGSGQGSNFSLIKLTDNGELDGTFAGSGWRIFNAAGGIERLARLNNGAIVFAGFRPSGDDRVGPVIGRVTPLGDTDVTFGDAQTPGYLVPDGLPQSTEVADATSLLAQSDGKLIASFGYYASERENFFAIRASPGGTLDEGFASGGIFQFDASQNGVFSEVGALLLQSDGRLVAAGRAQATSDQILIDFAAVRLLTSTDVIFYNGFDDSHL